MAIWMPSGGVVEASVLERTRANSSWMPTAVERAFSCRGGSVFEGERVLERSSAADASSEIVRCRQNVPPP
jgi:hypothetical protein